MPVEDTGIRLLVDLGVMGIITALLLTFGFSTEVGQLLGFSMGVGIGTYYAVSFAQELLDLIR